jgi:hypothetical protein
VVSKLLTGQRIITLEQNQKLILNTNINSHWFITGEGLMLKDQGSSVKESKWPTTSVEIDPPEQFPQCLL